MLGACAFYFSFDDPWTLRGDNKAALYPLNLTAYRSWLSGYAPEWSGGLWSGYPLLSDPTSGSLYWPNFLFFLLTPEPHLRAYDLATAFHLALMTAGTVRLLQALGASPTASVFGGMLNLLAPAQLWRGTGILHSYAPLAWWPWLFLAAERLSRSGTHRLGAPMFIGWLALSSQALYYPEFALYSGIVAALWLLTRSGELALRERVLRAATLSVGGLALAAPQLLPTALYQSGTIRGEALSLHEAALIAFKGSLWTAVLPDGTGGGNPQFIGGAALIIAAVALVTRQRRAVFLSVVALLAFGLALGTRTPLFGWLHQVPPFDRFRTPMKFFLLLEFAIVWLAGLGAHELLRRRPVRWLGVVALALMVASLGERVIFIGQRLQEDKWLPGAALSDFVTDHDRMLRSGLIEVAAGESGQPPPRTLTMLWLANMPLMYGVEQFWGGPTPLKPSQHRQLLPGIHSSRASRHARRAMLDLWGIHYLLTGSKSCDLRAKREGLIVVARTATTCVFENPSRPPRYSLLESFSEVSSWEAMASMVDQYSGGPVPVQAPGAGTDLSARTSSGEIEVRAYRPGAVHLEVDAEGPALLLVRESLIDGWRAEIDGANVPLYPAAGLFFAVPVPAGVHDVRLSYRAAGFRAGLVVSGVWILGTMALWRFRGRGRRVREDPEQAGSEASTPTA